jgi:hypothetical protein
MKKSILLILPDLNAGGAERIVTTIANHLPGAEILGQNHDSEAIKNSIQSRFSKEMILEKYFEVFEKI